MTFPSSGPGRFLLLFLLLAASFLPLAADTSDPELDAANRAFTYGSYDEAAGLFQKIIAARGYSAALCFNLANAEAKANHPGLAMLNYERARYLAPGDADINHNLQLARQQAGLDPNSYRWWEVLMRSINWTVWLVLMVACLSLLLFAVVGTALKLPSPTLRTTFRLIFFIGTPLLLIFCFVELACIGFNNRVEGVIIAPKAANLLLSPIDGAEKIGTIPEGELVTVEGQHDKYFRIEARDHHFGWVQQQDIEPVIADSFGTKPAN